MLAKDQESQAISQMRVLFGKPPLIKGESEEDYWKFWDAFVEDIKPKRWPDWIVANDLAHKYWEQLRLRRYSPALIEGACIEALEVLLRPFLRQAAEAKGASTDKKAASSDNEVSSDIARFYYVGLGGAKQRAILYVAECGITTDQIFALAMQMRGSGLLMLDRMDGNRENACRALRKEIERRSAASENPPDRKPVDENQEAQQ
jgi:hypothetical protein